MSAGDLRRQRIAGALLLGAIAAAVAAVVVLPGRPMTRGLRFEVELSSTGPLKSDARIKLAGRDAGVVLGMRPAGKGSSHVVVDCFVDRAAAPYVRDTSDVFISTPSVLGEAYLEIGPARVARGPRSEQADPGSPIADGQRLRGSDPPDLGQLLARVFTSTTTILLLLRAQEPAFAELASATRSLRGTLAALPAGADLASLRRIRAQLDASLDSARALRAHLAATDAPARLAVVAREAQSTATRVRPRIDELVAATDEARAHFDQLAALVPADRRAAAAAAIDSIAHAAQATEDLLADVRAIDVMIGSATGSLGKFLVDKELFDDLHEAHRILKNQPWSLLRRRPVRTPMNLQGLRRPPP